MLKKALKGAPNRSFSTVWQYRVWRPSRGKSTHAQPEVKDLVCGHSLSAFHGQPHMGKEPGVRKHDKLATLYIRFKMSHSRDARLFLQFAGITKNRWYFFAPTISRVMLHKLLETLTRSVS